MDCCGAAVGLLWGTTERRVSECCDTAVVLLSDVCATVERRVGYCCGTVAWLVDNGLGTVMRLVM